jgi:hypothetical protein
MNKNRIGGLRWRAKRPLTTKPISIKPTGGRSPGLKCFTFAAHRLYDAAHVAAQNRGKRQWKILLPRA